MCFFNFLETLLVNCKLSGPSRALLFSFSCVRLNSGAISIPYDYLICNLMLPFSIKPIAENLANDNKGHELQIRLIVFAAFAQC